MSATTKWKNTHDTSLDRQAFHRAAVAMLLRTGWTLDVRTGCLLWNGPNNGRKGYGYVYAAGRKVLAHQLALEMTLGRPIKPGLLSIHSCDRPGCINPLHLREGTYAMNARDRLERTGYFGATLTHCARGHAYDEDNTRNYTAPDGETRRFCRACERIRWQRKAAAAKASK